MASFDAINCTPLCFCQQAQSLEVRAVDDVEVEEAEHFDSIRVQVESEDLGYQTLDILQVVRIAENDLSRTSKPIDRWGGQVHPHPNPPQPSQTVILPFFDGTFPLCQIGKTGEI
jgi:hypothetical protein